MKYLLSLLSICIPFLSLAQAVTISGHSLPALRQSQAILIPHVIWSHSFKHLPFFTAKKAALSLEEVMLQSPSQVPRAWSYQNLAFFCKLEVKLEKTTNLPIKFRLGEVQYAENREGKYGRLQQQLGN